MTGPKEATSHRALFPVEFDAKGASKGSESADHSIIWGNIVVWSLSGICDLV